MQQLLIVIADKIYNNSANNFKNYFCIVYMVFLSADPSETRKYYLVLFLFFFVELLSTVDQQRVLKYPCSTRIPVDIIHYGVLTKCPKYYNFHYYPKTVMGYPKITYYRTPKLVFLHSAIKDWEDITMTFCGFPIFPLGAVL